MIILERFLNSVDANLCAAFLQSEGIDAEVFGDSALVDGIGAIKNGVRVVVPNEQEESARKVLADYRKGDSGEE